MATVSWIKSWSLLLVFSYTFAQVASRDPLRDRLSQRQLHLPLILNSRHTPFVEGGKLGFAGLGDYLDMLVPCLTPLIPIVDLIQDHTTFLLTLVGHIHLSLSVSN